MENKRFTNKHWEILRKQKNADNNQKKRFRETKKTSKDTKAERENTKKHKKNTNRLRIKKHENMFSQNEQTEN